MGRTPTRFAQHLLPQVEACRSCFTDVAIGGRGRKLVNSTPHTSHFFVELQRRTCLKAQVWRAQRTFHVIACVIFMRSCCVFDSPRLSLPLLAVYLLSHHSVHLPGLMITLAPLPSMTLSQVMSPTTTTSRRPLNCTSRNPPARTGPRMTLSTMTSPSAWRSLHHCSPRSEKMQRAVDELITLKTKVCCPVEQFDSQIPNVREIPSHSSGSEQIRILLERQRKQILADCRAEIQRHEFQADYDRRNIQKLNEMIESQRGEIHRAHQGDELFRRDQ